MRLQTQTRDDGDNIVLWRCFDRWICMAVIVSLCCELSALSRLLYDQYQEYVLVFLSCICSCITFIQQWCIKWIWLIKNNKFIHKLWRSVSSFCISKSITCKRVSLFNLATYMQPLRGRSSAPWTAAVAVTVAERQQSSAVKSWINIHRQKFSSYIHSCFLLSQLIPFDCDFTPTPLKVLQVTRISFPTPASHVPHLAIRQRLWLELAWICALYKFCNNNNNNNFKQIW